MGKKAEISGVQRIESRRALMRGFMKNFEIDSGFKRHSKARK